MSDRDSTTSLATRPRIGVIGLVPARDFVAFVGELRSRYPEAAITAVIGSSDLQVDGAADEYLLWGSLPARALVGEIRRRRFDLLAVAYNPEYMYTPTYWKALALTLLSRTKGLVFCEQARLPQAVSLPSLGKPRAVAATLLSVAVKMVMQPIAYLARETAIIAVSSLLLFVVLGIIVVDGADAVAGIVTRRGRARPPRP